MIEQSKICTAYINLTQELINLPLDKSELTMKELRRLSRNVECDFMTRAFLNLAVSSFDFGDDNKKSVKDIGFELLKCVDAMNEFRKQQLELK